MTLPLELAREAQDLIAGRLGLDLSEHRQADLERALATAGSRFPSTESYLSWLSALPGDSAEWRRLAIALTVGETYFFRDPAAFEALEREVFPGLIADKRSLGALRLRVWSAGCATGEEPYSVAILIDRLLPDRARWSLTILATDLNREALDAARRGLYREWALRETPPEVRERYFRHRSGALQLDPAIRRMVTFAPLNLAEQVYPDAVTNTTAMDLILCRNVVMYFTRDVRRQVTARLRRALVTGGFLALSPAEASAELLRPLVPVGFPGAVFYRRDPPHETAARRWEVPPPAAATFDLARAGPPGPEPDGPGPSDSGCAHCDETRLEELQVGGPPEVAPAAAETGEAFARARALADSGRLEEARDLCRAALQEEALNPDGHVLLAAIAQELGEIAGALEALRKAIYLAPDSATAHFLLGALHWRQGERRRGRRALETAIRLLIARPADEPVAGGGGLTAARLREAAEEYLEER